MIPSWRRRRAARRAGKNANDKSSLELLIPHHFKCPISLDLMKDPVTLSTGITYDRESIETWIESGNHTCPITNQELTSVESIPNHTIRKMVQDWCIQNQSFGFERIPTPRIPVTSSEVTEILLEVAAAWRGGEEERFVDLVEKIKGLANESERNRRCIVGNGTGPALCEAFKGFSEGRLGTKSEVLGVILSALTLISPLDEETKSNLGSSSCLKSMVWILKYGDPSGRRNSIMVMKQILSSDQSKIDDLVEIEGALEALVKLIKEPICSTTTKVSLMTIYHMVSPSPSQPSPANEKLIRPRFADMGMVSLLLETIADSDRGICERALGVLNGLCSCDEGREKAYAHALTVPALVKKILRVSDLATEFSVSILWKLIMNEEERGEEGGGHVLVEALQMGAFQKLLLLLQVGCSERTKEKATELMRLLNLHRVRLECIDPMDFKHLKGP